jgi:hypothetical protein
MGSALLHRGHALPRRRHAPCGSRLARKLGSSAEKASFDKASFRVDPRRAQGSSRPLAIDSKDAH